MLRRAVKFLRVVESGGKFDALDQLTDTPRPEETIYAYEVVGEVGMMHLNKRGGGGFYPIATYRLVTSQPTDAQMRRNDAWRDWCLRTARQTSTSKTP